MTAAVQAYTADTLQIGEEEQKGGGSAQEGGKRLATDPRSSAITNLSSRLRGDDDAFRLVCVFHCLCTGLSHTEPRTRFGLCPWICVYVCHVL